MHCDTFLCLLLCYDLAETNNQNGMIENYGDWQLESTEKETEVTLACPIKKPSGPSMCRYVGTLLEHLGTR